LGAPEHPDAWVQDGLKLPAGGRDGKNEPRQFSAAQPAVRPGDFGAENGQDFSQRRLARLDNLARQVVGIHYPNSTVAEQLGGGGLAHANAASKTEHFHPKSRSQRKDAKKQSRKVQRDG
jgi:hypothetical protein